MTQAQALALIDAIQAYKVNASANMMFDSGGNETWSVTIPPTVVLTGSELGSLATYCSTQGLTLSASFSYLGVM